MVHYILEQKVPKVDAEASHDAQTYLPDIKWLQQVGSSSSASVLQESFSNRREMGWKSSTSPGLEQRPVNLH